MWSQDRKVTPSFFKLDRLVTVNILCIVMKWSRLEKEG
jgi:hypothetical protein